MIRELIQRLRTSVMTEKHPSETVAWDVADRLDELFPQVPNEDRYTLQGDFATSAMFMRHGKPVSLKKVVEALNRDAVASWQPISTAPMEGQYLVWVEDPKVRLDANRPHIFIVERIAEDSFLIVHDADYGYLDWFNLEPTHWMPMPDPPKKLDPEP